MKLELFPVSGRTAAVEAMAADQIDLVLTGPAEYVVFHARLKAQPVVSWGRPDYYSQVVVLENGPIRSSIDLKGKKIAISRYGSSTHKQVYIYGRLSLEPTILGAAYGMAWGVGGFLLTPFHDDIWWLTFQCLFSAIQFLDLTQRQVGTPCFAFWLGHLCFHKLTPCMRHATGHSGSRFAVTGLAICLQPAVITMKKFGRAYLATAILVIIQHNTGRLPPGRAVTATTIDPHVTFIFFRLHNLQRGVIAPDNFPGE
jgi:hypothetical protein